MRGFKTLIITLALGLASVSTQAQTIKILALDTFIGAVNGSALAGATMLITEDADWGPLRVGFGAGTLYGLGLGIYDVSQAAGSGYLINGTFGSASNTAQIVLLDTFYGSATGSIVGFAISLLSNSDMVDGLRLGAGYGAWGGFAFGLVDGFVLSGGSGYDFSDDDGGFSYQRTQPLASGIIKVPVNDATSLGFLSPKMFQTYSNGQTELHTGINVSSFRINF